MDWLMGKARGVGKGLMNTGAPSNLIAELTQHSIESTVNHSVCSNDVECKHIGVALREAVVSPSSRSLSPVNLSSPMDASSSPTQKATQGTNSASSTLESTCSSSDVPVFMQAKYVSQQIPSADPKHIDFRDLVEPFPAMDLNEWLAAHTIALFENMSTVFDAIQELCTCPHLVPNHGISVPCSSACTNVREGFVSDDDRCKRTKQTFSSSTGSARQEIDSALSSCHDLIQSSAIFPVRNGDHFPTELPTYVTVICRNLLLCIIHLYLGHFHHLEQLDLLPHVNTLTKHFFAFTTRFSLVEDKHVAPLLGFGRLLNQEPDHLTVDPSE
ncbi:unnamed protein product [Dicrocoelium dendriticum]|nr:unnamed protein product [Dicrocoelium dendriticum]